MAVAIGLLIGAPLATFLLWTRVRGPRPLRTTARMGMILTCQLAAILVAGLVVNAKFGLYGSWSDLLGRTGDAGVIVPTTAQQPQALGGHGLNVSSERDGRVRFTHSGDKLVTTLDGQRSHLAGEVYVWLPPQYDEPAYAHMDFPVIELFQGTPGTADAWFAGLRVDKFVGSLLATDHSKPFILVAPDINLIKGHDAACSNIPRGPQVATWLVNDVRTMMTDNFRVESNRAGWATMGFSEGGYCAEKLPLQYPGMFRASVALSGYDYADGDLLPKAGKNALRANDPYLLIKRPIYMPLTFLLAATAQDGTTLPEAYDMQRLAQDERSHDGSLVSIEVLAKKLGKHNTAVWREWLPDAFSFLNEELTGTEPITPPHTGAQAQPVPLATRSVPATPPPGPLTARAPAGVAPIAPAGTAPRIADHTATTVATIAP
jgi:hypothetical protein